MHAPPLDPSLKGKNVQVKFFDTDMSEEWTVSLDTYIHHQFLMIANDLLDQNPSGSKLDEILNGTKMVKDYNPYLDAPSDGEQDSSDKEMGRSPRLFTPPPDKDTIKTHWDDYKLDAQHDSHMDDDYSYRRYICF